MILYVLAFLGGVLTIVSPCILPVLPFVFSRADQPFRRSGLPLLAGMAITFSLVAATATLAGSWICSRQSNRQGLGDAHLRAAGNRLVISRCRGISVSAFREIGRTGGGKARYAAKHRQISGSGASTGLLWAPCAGPILGLILTGAAVKGASLGTLFLLAAFAGGAACSLAIVLLAGNRVFAALKRSLGVEVWIRRVLGVAVLVGVVAIGAGWDTGFLARLSLGTTSGLEQQLIDQLHPARFPGERECFQRIARCRHEHEGAEYIARRRDEHEGIECGAGDDEHERPSARRGQRGSR